MAEDEDKGVKMRRTKSKSQLSGTGKSLLTVNVVRAGSASASPATTPPVSPLSLPEDDGEGVVMLPPADTLGKEKKDVSAAAAATVGGSGSGGLSGVEEDDEDEEMVKQLVLKSMLTVKVEWKGDTELIVIRENGEQKTLTL